MKKFLALMMALSLLFALTACDSKQMAPASEKSDTATTTLAEAEATSSAETTAAPEESEEVSLSDWEGEWNSLGAYLDDPELQDSFAEMAEKHGETIDEVKAEIQEQYGLPFGALKVEGNQMIFFEGKASESKEIETVAYKYLKSHAIEHGGNTYYWYIFQAEGDATYPIIFLMPAHGEDSLLHFHMRYGDDIQELLKKDDWYPTLVKPNATMEQLAEVFAHHDGDHDHDHDHEHGDEHGDHDHDHEHGDEEGHEHEAPERVVLEDVSLADWEGEWNSMSSYIEDEELAEAFAASAKAEKKSVEELKKSYLEKYKIDFEAMVFTEDSIAFYDKRLKDEGKENAKLKYHYLESYKMKHGKYNIEWHVFEAEEGGEYKYIMLMPVHGEETLAHFHMRYGDDVEKMLEAEDWYPTFIKPSTSYEQLADVFGPDKD